MDEEGSGLPSNLEELATIVEDADSKITEYQAQQEQEDVKMERYKVNCVLRLTPSLSLSNLKKAAIFALWFWRASAH